MKNRPVIAFIDRSHVDDVLFLDRMGRHLASLGGNHRPLLFVHGSGPIAEEYLERFGTVPERSRGVLKAASPRERALVERGIRQQNQKVVAALTSAVVSSVSIQGADKGLVRVEDGRIAVKAAGWIEQLLEARVIPVLSSLAVSPDTGAVSEVSVADLVSSLAPVLDVEALLLFNRKNRKYVMRGGRTLEEAAASDVDPEYDDSDVLQALPYDRLKVYLTNFEGVEEGGGVGGTRIVA